MNHPAIAEQNTELAPSRVRRIALVAPLWMSVPPSSYGGTEMVVHLLAEELCDRGYQVTLFASGDSSTRAHLRPILPSSVVRTMAGGTAQEYEHYANAALVEAILAEDEFDVIHVHLGYPQLAIGALARIPALFTLHTVPTMDDHWVLRRFPHLAYTAVSNHQASRFPPMDNADISVVHNGIDFDSYRVTALPGDYLAFLGRLAPQKSPLDAIRIAKLADVPLVLAGEPQNAGERAYFDREVAPLIDGVRIRYIGGVDHEQRNELLANAGALLFPIRGEESFGLAMIEAMACGTPVVAANRASVPEIVDFGVTGYYGDTLEDIAALVGRALQLDRRNVREHARTRFSHAGMVERYEAIYHRLHAHYPRNEQGAVRAAGDTGTSGPKRTRS